MAGFEKDKKNKVKLDNVTSALSHVAGGLRQLPPYFTELPEFRQVITAVVSRETRQKEDYVNKIRRLAAIVGSIRHYWYYSFHTLPAIGGDVLVPESQRTAVARKFYSS